LARFIGTNAYDTHAAAGILMSAGGRMTGLLGCSYLNDLAVEFEVAANGEAIFLSLRPLRLRAR
jgi:hypothetical protein